MFDSPELIDFRRQVRSFVQARLPADVREAIHHGRQINRAQYDAWHQVLATQGWLVPHWPVAWGGQGWPIPANHLDGPYGFPGEVTNWRG